MAAVSTSLYPAHPSVIPGCALKTLPAATFSPIYETDGTGLRCLLTTQRATETAGSAAMRRVRALDTRPRIIATLRLALHTGQRAGVSMRRALETAQRPVCYSTSSGSNQATGRC